MKTRFLMLFACAAGLLSFTLIHDPVPNNKSGEYGEKTDTTNAADITQLEKSMEGKAEMPCRVKGVISQICQAKGCWFKYEAGDHTIMVKMKDHAFLLPKDQSGKIAYVEGTAYMDTTSVAMLKHYAEDAGKSDEEIEKITEPEIELIIEANGVVIR